MVQAAGTWFRSLEAIPDDEDAAIERIRRAVLDNVDRDYHRGGYGRRDAHQKAHGCVEAVFRVAENLPEELHTRVLQPGAVYSAWIRFSNGNTRSDRAPDAHGMAIKLMGVLGTSATDGRPRSTQDFVMIDSPRFFIPDARRYAEFMERGKRRFFASPRNWWLFTVFFALGKRPLHPLGTSYFSAVPFRLGARAVKYRAVPRTEPVAPDESRCPSHRLYEALQHHLSSGDFAFDFDVQQFRDEKATPIENPTKVWNTPFTTVARIEIPTQNLSHGKRVQLAEQLSFDPWNSVAEHAPLGGINRVRRVAYTAVSARRHALNGEPRFEPTPESVPEYRTDAPLLEPIVHANQRHGELAVVATVRRGEEPAVAALLAQIDSELGKGTDLRDAPDKAWTLPLFRARSIHFARLVLVEPATEGGRRHLVLSTNFDGGASAHRDELVQTCGDGLAALFEHCEEYDGDVGRMLARGTPAQAFYVGAPGRAVARIRAEDDLRVSIEQFLDGEDWSGVAPAEVRARIRRYVFERLDQQWLLEPPPLPRMTWGWLLAGLVAGAAAVALGPVLVFGPLWLVVPGAAVVGAAAAYTALARADRADADAWQPATPRRNLHEGPAPVQNWLTHRVAVRPGRFRRGVLRVVLFAINTLARTRFNQGDLGGITTIHFARWLFLPDGRLLFFSNYGGTWSAYLDAFIDEAALGLTSVWSNTEGFPPTRPLFEDGASDGPRFKDWTRAHQQDTDVWYSAYPHLSVKNINQNSRIRLGLYGDMTDAEVGDWLHLFGRAP